MKKLFFITHAKVIDEIDVVLSMMGTEGENFVSTGVA